MPAFLKAGRFGSPRLLGFVLPVIAAGLPVAVGAASRAADSAPDAATLGGVTVFFALALMAELRPLALDSAGDRLVSFAFVFVVGSGLLFGWQWSVLIGATAIMAAMAPGRPGGLKLLFNGAAYAVAAALAGLPSLLVGAPIGEMGYPELTAIVAAAGGIFVLTNVTLVCVAIAFASEEPVLTVLREHVRQSGQAFSIMVFVVVQAVIFWNLSPFLVALVGAPLFALTLYQRSSLRGRVAEAAASTDGLTGVKNRRAYERDMVELLEQADRLEGELSLCLIDVDRFKQVNDRHGHPVGDAILTLLGELLEEIAPGRGYRLGGDEFALLFPSSVEEIAEVCREFHHRFAERQHALVPDRVTLSSGLASFPEHAEDAHALEKRADLALYQSKHNGKNRTSVYEPGADVGDLAAEQQQVTRGRIDPRLATPVRLVTIVDGRAVSAAAEAFGRTQALMPDELGHSRNVAHLVRALGQILGIQGDELELLCEAGLLHDLGKIGVPETILNKPGPLTPEEFDVVREHSRIGYELLAGLGLAPLDLWILHHHEHWNGSGYPDGLAGAEIPFGSRVILVADAFDAMTSDRSYRRAISIEGAMQELRGESGRQFDPIVVAALENHLAQPVAQRACLELAWSS
jgi:diguanylate cyclase (GGDEF)-like protein